MTKKNDKDSLYCSFCGKNQKEVKKLIAGPTVFVCDECVELCMDIIKEDNKNNKFKIKKDIPKPSEINKFLNKPLQIYFIFISEILNFFMNLDWGEENNNTLHIIIIIVQFYNNICIPR